MARTAGDLLDPYIRGAGADRDAIIAGLDAGPSNRDVGGSLDMDAVGVWTVFRSCDLDTLQSHPLTVIDHNVEHLAVNR